MPDWIENRYRGAFNPETTRLLGQAYDDALEAVQHGSVEGLRQMGSSVGPFLAARILELARRGERDPNRLRDAALASLRAAMPDHGSLSRGSARAA
jgi:hypothetical protein